MLASRWVAIGKGVTVTKLVYCLPCCSLQCILMCDPKHHDGLQACWCSYSVPSYAGTCRHSLADNVQVATGFCSCKQQATQFHGAVQGREVGQLVWLSTHNVQEGQAGTRKAAAAESIDWVELADIS